MPNGIIHVSDEFCRGGAEGERRTKIKRRCSEGTACLVCEMKTLLSLSLSFVVPAFPHWRICAALHEHPAVGRFV